MYCIFKCKISVRVGTHYPLGRYFYIFTSYCVIFVEKTDHFLKYFTNYIIKAIILKYFHLPKISKVINEMAGGMRQ